MSLNGFRSDELDNIMKHISIKNNEFHGIFPCDHFLKLIKDNTDIFLSKISRFIVNLSSSNNSGSHWIAIVMKKDYTEYFDSLGVFMCFYLQKYIFHSKVTNCLFVHTSILTILLHRSLHSISISIYSNISEKHVSVQKLYWNFLNGLIR